MCVCVHVFIKGREGGIGSVRMCVMLCMCVGMSVCLCFCVCVCEDVYLGLFMCVGL